MNNKLVSNKITDDDDGRVFDQVVICWFPTAVTYVHVEYVMGKVALGQV
jgi:hypothetical protein